MLASGPEVITVAAGKGGVGKTTTAAAIAQGAAAMYPSALRRVLLVDLCAQGSLAILLGHDTAGSAPALLAARSVEAFEAGVLRDVRPGLDLLRCNRSMLRVEAQLVQAGVTAAEAARELRAVFGALPYSLVVVDTHPGYLAQEVGMALATRLVVPTSLEQLAVAEVGQTVGVAMAAGGKPQQIVVLPTFARARTVETRENLRLLQTGYPGQVAAAVPESEWVRRLSAEGRTVFDDLQPEAWVQAPRTAHHPP